MKALFTIIFLILSSNTYSWGPVGHNMTAKVAYNLLDQNVKDLLQKYNSIQTVDEFVKIANWADYVKSRPEYSWSYNLHFCDVYAKPLTRCNIEYKYDCVDERCIISAINNYTMRLTHNKTDMVSLSFIVHFMGDIFQPFHIGYLADLGANKIKVNFFEYNTVGWIVQFLYVIFGFILSSIFARRNTGKYTLWLDKNTEYE